MTRVVEMMIHHESKSASRQTPKGMSFETRARIVMGGGKSKVLIMDPIGLAIGEILLDHGTSHEKSKPSTNQLWKSFYP